ncbi:MAG: DNA-3-methyladenine glycosylase I [Lachnospiraceae bacterium]|jgi:DNA-3-methyladenine glycosylase I
MRTDYKKGMLQISSALREYYGLPYEYEPDALVKNWLERGHFRCVIALLVDAMGSRILDEHLRPDAFLNRFRADDTLTVFPPTTSAATISFLSGRSPAENGWLGWNQYFKELDDHVILFYGKSQYGSGRYPDYAADHLPVRRIYEELGSRGIRADSVWPSFGKYGCGSIDELCMKTCELAHVPDMRFIYAYWDQLDSYMHEHGPGDAGTDAQLAHINDVIEKMSGQLPADTGLLVLADHGQVDCVTKYLEDDEELCDCFRHAPALEPRVIAFYIKDGRKRDFQRIFRAHYGDSFELLSHRQVVQKQVFGPGRPHPRFEEFIGDYLAIAKTPLSLNYHRAPMAGNHAGEMEAEVMIPVILYPQPEGSVIGRKTSGKAETAQEKLPDGICGWAGSTPEELAYHNTRWCRPVHDDRELFAMLCLEGQQAGLSWSLIMKREPQIREAFDDFDLDLCASYDEEKIEALMANPAVIRNRLKIASVAKNARAFRKVQEEYGSFDRYIWGFTDGKIIMHHPHSMEEIPAKSPLSEAVSKDLKKRGFSFVGPVIIYSYLQAIGIINDHLESCLYKYR